MLIAELMRCLLTARLWVCGTMQKLLQKVDLLPRLQAKCAQAAYHQ